MVNLIKEIRGIGVGSELLGKEDKKILEGMIEEEIQEIGKKMQEIKYIDGYPITTLDAQFIVAPDTDPLVNLSYLIRGRYYEQTFPIDVFYNL